MQDALHISTSSPFPYCNSNANSKFHPLFLPRHLHFPPLHYSKSPSDTISLPPLPKPTSHILPPPPTPPSPSPTNSQVQENLLYLDSLGVDSFYCLTSHPAIISAQVADLKSLVDFLYSIHLTIQDLRRVVHMCPEILTTPLSSTLIPAVTFLLREAQVEGQDLPRVIRSRPRLLTRHVDSQLRPTLYFLQSTIGIEDVSRCTNLLSCCVESKFIPRLEYFQKLGFSKRESVKMFRRFPTLFCYSITENYEPKFNYFVVEMGRDLKELTVFPQYFSFSLENRIKPRHKKCVEKGVYMSLRAMLKSSEDQFRSRLEVCCNSSMPVRNSPLWCTDTDCNVT